VRTHITRDLALANYFKRVLVQLVPATCSEFFSQIGSGGATSQVGVFVPKNRLSLEVWSGVWMLDVQTTFHAPFSAADQPAVPLYLGTAYNLFAYLVAQIQNAHPAPGLYGADGMGVSSGLKEVARLRMRSPKPLWANLQSAGDPVIRSPVDNDGCLYGPPGNSSETPAKSPPNFD
jgi:hypothetical protein